MPQNLDTFKSVLNFSGGLNTDASTWTIQDHESPDLRNVRIDPLGPITGRMGAQVQNSTQIEAGHGILSMWRYYRIDGSHLLLFTTNDHLYAADDLGDIGSAAAVLDAPGGSPYTISADKRWEFVTIKDWVFFCELGSPVLRTNGVYIVEAGDAPTAAPTAATTAGTSHASGEAYYYKYTYQYVDGLGESPASPVIAAQFTVPGGGPYDINVTCTNSTHPDVDVEAIILYRTINNGPATGPFYRVKSQAQTAAPGPTVITDNVTDTSLGYKLDQTRIKHPQCGYVTIHKDRLVMARCESDQFTVSLSEPGAPEEFKSGTSYRFSNPNGEPITGAASYNGMLYVTTLNHIFALVGTGVKSGSALIPDFRVVELAKGPGAMSHRTIQQLDGSLYMMNHRDMWVVTGQQVLPLSRYRVRKFIRENVSTTQSANACGVSTHTHYRVTFPSVTGGTSTPDMTLIYDVQAGSFLVDEGYAVACYSHTNAGGDPANLYAGEATSKSWVYKMDAGLGDWHPDDEEYINIDRYFRTKDFVLGTVGESWQYRNLYVSTIQTGNTDGLTVWLYLNSDQFVQQLLNIDLTARGPKWGEFVWGQVKWGIAGTAFNKTSLPQFAKGERIGLKFQNISKQAAPIIEMIGIGGRTLGIRGSG